MLGMNAPFYIFEAVKILRNLRVIIKAILVNINDKKNDII